MEEDVQVITVPVASSLRVTRFVVPEKLPPGADSQRPVVNCPATRFGAAATGPEVAATGIVASVFVCPGVSVQLRRMGAGLAVALGAGLAVALAVALGAGLLVALGAGLAVELGAGLAMAPSVICGDSSKDSPSAVNVTFPAARAVTGWTAPGT